ncbi:hypothetical protein [Bradyrhizobium sp.]|uniref:hypothetical protein n=1 Tax=Bradyrhizobium sp. TaxID=376 RepID=UPI00260A9563|nr:hypothetical protein [Bradyrhizobium sp.]
MAKDPDRKRGRLDVEETGGGLSGLLAEEDEFDRRTLWRLGTWAAISVGAVVVALVTNQSSIGLRREQTASVDLMKQAQQLQLTAKESQNETHRLASAVDTLNGDRDRLYARVAVLEQGLDSVTGAISRQAPAPSLQPTGASPAKAGQAGANAAPSASSSAPQPASAPATATTPVAPTVTASTAPAVTASAELPPAASKPTPPVPVVTSVAATMPVTADKKDKQASTTVPPEPSSAMKLANAQQSASVQPFGYLMAPKSMMAPPDPAAEKLIEPTSPPRQASPPKTFTSAPMPEIAAVAPKASEEKASEEKALEEKTSEEKAAGENEPDSPPELVARRTEFGVDVGGANSLPGLRALWRGLLKSRSNAALATLRPIIVIKENNNGLGMQLRLVAGPINDAAAAAKICASLTVSDRGCSTTVFEGQRLSMGADQQPKVNTRTSSETKPASEARPEAETKPKYPAHRHYAPKRQAKEDDPPPPPPKEEQPSTLSLIFGKH